MTKTTKEQLRWLVGVLNQQLGVSEKPYDYGVDGKLQPQPGCIVLDHDDSGYKLEQMLESHGVETVIDRCQAKEMWHALRGLLEGVKLTREVNHES